MAFSKAAVFLFPGQGNDSCGALLRLSRSAGVDPAVVDSVLDQVDTIAMDAGFPPTRPLLLAEPGTVPVTELPGGLPQLATFAAGVVVDRVLELLGVRPAAVVGQSLGEIAALVSAGALSVDDGARAVCALNRAFQTHDGGGGMVMVRADEENATALLEQIGHPGLALAAVNSPRQSVVSGTDEAIASLLARAGLPGVPAMLRLPVPYATHHPSLTPVAEQFLGELAQIPLGWPIVPVHSPVRRRRYVAGDDLRLALADCVVRPVYLAETLQRMGDAPDRVFIEAGPGDAMVRAVRINLPDARTMAPLRPLRGGDVEWPAVLRAHENAR